MKNLFLIGSLLGTLSLYAGEDNPPAYTTKGSLYAKNMFLDALDSEDTGLMLARSENFFDMDYIHAWVLATAATAYEKNGEASFFIAQRLLAGPSDRLYRRELKLVKDGGSCEKLGHYYLQQAYLQKHAPASKLFEERTYKQFSSSYDRTLHDETFPTFKRLIGETKKFESSDFIKHADGFNNLTVPSDPEIKHSLRGLALAVIGFNQYLRYPEVALWLGKFISNRSDHDLSNYQQYRPSIQNIFIPNLQLGKQLIDSGVAQSDSPPCPILCIQAELNEATGNKPEALKQYRALLKRRDFVIPDRALESSRVQHHFELERSSSCIVQ